MGKLNKILLFNVILTCCISYLQSCVTVSRASLQRVSVNEIPAYSISLPNREFIEINYLQADGFIFRKPDKLLSKLLQNAKTQGADAVVSVKFSYVMWLPYVSGIAIKYK